MKLYDSFGKDGFRFWRFEVWINEPEERQFDFVRGCCLWLSAWWIDVIYLRGECYTFERPARKDLAS